MIRPDHERVRPATGPGFADAVTFAFGDPGREVYGSARVGIVAGRAQDSGTALGLLFSGGDPAVVEAAGPQPLDQPDWARISVGDVSVATAEPLRSWRVVLDADGGGFDLAFSALSEPAELEPDSPAGRAASLAGYEQLCRVRGSVRVGSKRVDVECLGQRGHQWGAPDWRRIDRARTLAAWVDAGSAVVLIAIRPAGARGHSEEAVTAHVLAADADGEPGAELPGFAPVGEPRLTTAYDELGRQRRAGLELWPPDEGSRPCRASGEALCGTSLTLGELTLECSFFRWHMGGRAGVGRYDVVRRVGG